MDKIIPKNSGIDIEELKKATREPGILIPLTNPVKELKHKKGIPTVIEYQGRRYVLDLKGGRNDGKTREN